MGMSGTSDEAPKKPHHAPTALVQQVEEGAPSEYTGKDKAKIFRYACESSHEGTSIFPYYEGSQQKGLIARVSIPTSESLPLDDSSLKDRYYSFVSQIRSTMKGNNTVGRIDSKVAGQGPVKWQYIAVGKPNPERPSTLEIVLYAEKPLGVK